MVDSWICCTNRRWHDSRARSPSKEERGSQPILLQSIHRCQYPYHSGKACHHVFSPGQGRWQPRSPRFGIHLSRSDYGCPYSMLLRMDLRLHSQSGVGHAMEACQYRRTCICRHCTVFPTYRQDRSVDAPSRCHQVSSASRVHEVMDEACRYTSCQDQILARDHAANQGRIAA